MKREAGQDFPLKGSSPGVEKYSIFEPKRDFSSEHLVRGDAQDDFRRIVDFIARNSLFITISEYTLGEVPFSVLFTPELQHVDQIWPRTTVQPFEQESDIERLMLESDLEKLDTWRVQTKPNHAEYHRRRKAIFRRHGKRDIPKDPLGHIRKKPWE